MNHHHLAITLSARPGWDKLNAYDRTKVLCAELTRAGEAVPAWTAVREIIGKGSSNDINRAKIDFRQEHAEELRKMEGFSAEGVPPSLTPLVVGIWREAVGHARKSFTDQVSLWEEAIEQAGADRESALAEVDRLRAEVHAGQAKIEGVEQARAALQDQVRSEQGARAQAEKMAEELRADLLALRDRLEKAQAHAQAELDKAIGRLESTERRSMMEIERARQESAKKVEDAEARLKTAEDKNLLDATRLSKQIQDGRDNAKRMQDRINVLERDKQMLLERATRAEVREREMKTQNEKLLAKQARPELRAGVTSGDPIRLRKLRAAKKPQGQ